MEERFPNINGQKEIEEKTWKLVKLLLKKQVFIEIGDTSMNICERANKDLEWKMKKKKGFKKLEAQR